MRNEDFKLDKAQAANTATRVRQLRGREGERVTIEFTNREGEERSYTGTIESIKADASNASHHTVTLDVGNGYRTANLWAVHKVTF